MKSDFHFHFYSRIAILAVLGFVLFFMQYSVETTALESDYDIKGWAWSDYIGWVSLDCMNDTDGDGEPNDNCSVGGNPYDWGLDVRASGDIEGCGFAGNSLSPGGDPLGWICFSDVGGLDINVTSDPAFGVSTTTLYTNALDPGTFASILNEVHYVCAGGDNDGLPCFDDTDCVGTVSGTCSTFIDDDAWKLGFPIENDASSDVDAPYYIDDDNKNELEGCFNCFEEFVYRCSITSLSCDPDAGCPDSEGNPQTCDVVDINYNCDNCLEYFYYQGRCSGDDTVRCKNDDDCNGVGICNPISTCSHDIETECENDIPDCGDLTETCIAGSCSNNPYIGCTQDSDCWSLCTEREVGSLKKILGAYDCTECTIENYENVCGVNSYQGNVNRCADCNSLYYTPGVMLDHQHYTLDPTQDAALCGWAWNSYDDVSGNTYGFGWVQFGPRVVTTTRPYLSSEGGNIYSRGDIVGRYTPPFGRYNASYLIEAGGNITNFISSSTLEGLYQGEMPYRPEINFLSSISGGRYSNALGVIDYDGLWTRVGATDFNKYGSELLDVDPENVNTFLNPISAGPFDGGTFYVNDNIVIPGGGGIIIQPGATASEKGSGVIIIDGDLTINRNVVYGTLPSYDNLRQIPSLVWIVRGDLFVGSDVEELAGTFIILGDPNGAETCNPVVSSCGQFVSCNDVPEQCNKSALVVKGNVIAKYFDLGRRYVNSTTKEPAEKFVNDGRLQANPPPGFVEFSELIPRFTNN